VDHLLGREKIRVDIADKLREEIRHDLAEKKKEIVALEARKDKEIAEVEARKDKKIDALEKRVDKLERELGNAERARFALEESLAKERIAVYRALIEYGANRDLINAVLAIQER
jgi:predicted RNase H-like nuclease (RuvC/YqgF family)